MPNPSLSLLGKVEEICTKLNSTRPQCDHSEDGSVAPKVFKCKLSMNFLDKVLVGEGESIKKKSAKHLAAGNILLQIAEHDQWKDHLSFAKSAEEAKNLINEQLESFEKDGAGGVNSVVALHALCKQCKMVDPSFQELEQVEDVFAVQCQVLDKFTTQGRGHSKKAAKANAAEEMHKKLTEILHQSNLVNTSREVGNLSAAEYGISDAQSSKGPEGITQEDRDAALTAIEKTSSSSSVDRCYRAIMFKFRAYFQMMYNREFEWVWENYRTRETRTGSFPWLETLHAVDVKKRKELGELEHSCIIFSYFGSAEVEGVAKNECARHALKCLSYWLDFRVKILQTAKRIVLPQDAESEPPSPVAEEACAEPI